MTETGAPSPVAPSNVHNFLIMYEKLCDDIALHPRNYRENVLCAVAIFQKNIEHKLVCDDAFGHIYIDWDHVGMLPQYNVYKNPNSWITLLSFLDCTTDDAKWKQLLAKNRVVAYFYECLSTYVSDIAHSDVIRLFVLINIVNLEALNIFELYFAETSSVNMRECGMLFFSRLANEQYDRRDRTNAIANILTQHLHVRVDDIVNEVEIMRTHRASVRESMIQRNMRAVNRRPQLRSKQRNFDTVVDDSFKMWRDRIRFSHCFSIISARKFYFLMAQTHFDPKTVLPALLRDDELLSNILTNVVKHPETAALVDVIVNARLCAAPFPELHAFREKGIASFSMLQRSKLRLNDLLHLYIAAYQPDWKAAWCAVVPILSTQIIHDVDDFVKEYKINVEQVVKAVFDE